MQNLEDATQVLAGYDSVFLQFIKNCLRIVAPDREIITPLKMVYIEYKKQAVLEDISPMQYKIFRKALGEILVFLKKDVQMYQRNKTWLIKNVALVDSEAIQELYEKFSNFNKDAICQN